MKLFKYIVTAACAATISINTFAQDANRTQQAIDNFTNIKALQHASVGVSVISLDDLSVVGEYAPNQSQITASTMKTLTSATALKMLGKDFRFHTRVYAEGNIHNSGRLDGNVVIVGGGDPTLGSTHMPDQPDFIQSVITALKEKGVKEIKGCVMVDDSAYPAPYVPATWMIEDLGYGYGTSVHALNFADNTLKLRANISTDSFTYCTEQAQTYFTVENHCKVVATPSDSLKITGYDMRLDIENDILHLSGNVKPGRWIKTVANPSPDLLLRDSLVLALRKAGIVVKNTTTSPNPSRNEILDYTSPALSEIVLSLLERSDNMFTECVLRAIAINAHKEATSENGVDVVKAFWEERGVDVSGLFMYDGSGLSRTDKAPVSFFTHMLAVAHKELKEDGVEFHTLFPIAGKNGTVKRLTKDTTAEGKFALKSGSMSHVQCYVGYYPVKEPKYVVGVLVNSFTCPSAELRKNITKMLVEIDKDLSKKK